MKTILFTITLLFFITTIANSQNADLTGDFIIVRTFEVISGSFWKSQISISDGKGDLKTVDLAATKPKTAGVNLKTIVSTLNNIKNQGYTLVQTNSAGANQHGIFITNYIFQKKNEMEEK